MKSIRQKDLESIVIQLNLVTKSPEHTWTKRGAKLKANIGNYHLDYAYGGVALHRIVSDGGGVSDIFCGHHSKRELHARLTAYLMGLCARGDK